MYRIPITVHIAMAPDCAPLALGTTAHEARRRARDAYPDELDLVVATLTAPRAAVAALTGMHDAEDHLLAVGL